MNNAEFITEYISRSSLLIALICGLICLGNFILISAVLRHRIGMIGIFFALLMPPLLLAGWQWEVVPSQAIETVELVIFENAEPIMSATSAGNLHAVTSSLNSTGRTGSVDIPGIMLILWLVGAVAYVLYALTGFVVLCRINRAPLTNDSRLGMMLDSLRCSQKIKIRVKLVTSEKVLSPFTWGVFHPMIALPLDAENWSTEKIRLVLLHELAHVGRRDALSLMLSRLLLALNWFNPLAWYLSRKLENLREEVCDGLVLREGTSPSDYAECLVQMASKPRSNRNFSIAVSETKTIERRIKMILNHSSKLIYRPRKIINWISAGAVTTLAFLITTLAIAEAGKNDSLAEAQAKKLEQIIIPKVDFVDTPVKEAVNFLVHRSRDLDAVSTKPDEKGVNAVLLGDFSNVKVTLKLSDIPVGSALKYAASLAGAEFEKKNYTVVIRSKKAPFGNKASSLSEKVDSKIGEKLYSLILTDVQFKDTPLDQALSFIHDRSAKLSGDNKGVNIILIAAEDKPTVTLNLRNVPIGSLIELTAEAAGYQAMLEEHAVIVKKGVLVK